MAFEPYDEELDAELFAVAIADPSTEVLNLIGQTPEACARQLLARHQPDRLQTLKEDGPILSYVGFTVQRWMLLRLPLRGPLDNLLELVEESGDLLKIYADLAAANGEVGARELVELIEHPVTYEDRNCWLDDPAEFDSMLSFDPAALLPYLTPEVRHRVILATEFAVARDLFTVFSQPAQMP